MSRRAIAPVAALLGAAAVVALWVLAPAQTEDPATSQATTESAVGECEPLRVTALDLIPAESLLCWYGRPFPDAPAPSERPSTLQTVSQLVSRFAGSALDPQARIWARAGEAFSRAIKFPHVFALVDASAVPRAPDSEIKQADDIRFAMVVRTAGREEPFVRIIQAAVNELTDSENASLSRREAGDWVYQELRDQRLPEWCSIAWGKLDDYFVFTVGRDVWPQIARVARGEALSILRDPWVRSVRGERAEGALIEIVVDGQEIRKRLDPVLDHRASAFFNAWHAQYHRRDHWALGFEDRALYCVAHFLMGDTVRKVYADPGIRDPKLLAAVPEEARYAIYTVEAGDMLPRFFNGLLATRRPEERANIRRIWREIQQQHGFDANEDILANLGDHIIMHNVPAHPLHVPLAMTTLTEIEKNPRQVRRAIDVMCTAWRDDQQRRIDEGDVPDTFRIKHDPSGMWYVELGPSQGPSWAVIAGPAWIVTESFLITSWSPAALRTYLDRVGQGAGMLPQAGP